MRLALSTAVTAAVIGLGVASGASAATCQLGENTLRVVGATPAAACSSAGQGSVFFEGVDNGNQSVLVTLRENVPDMTFLGWAKRVENEAFSQVMPGVPDGVTEFMDVGLQAQFSDTSEPGAGIWSFSVPELVVLSHVNVGFRLGVEDTEPGLGWGVFWLEPGATSGEWFSLIVNSDPVPGGPGIEEMYVWGSATIIPLPPAILLLGSALGGLVLMRRRKTAA